MAKDGVFLREQNLVDLESQLSLGQCKAVLHPMGGEGLASSKFPRGASRDFSSPWSYFFVDRSLYLFLVLLRRRYYSREQPTFTNQ